MVSKRTLARLLGAFVVLPMSIVLITGISALLAAMGDAWGAAAAVRVAWGLGVLWALSLVVLLTCLTLHLISSGENEVHGTSEPGMPASADDDELA